MSMTTSHTAVAPGSGGRAGSVLLVVLGSLAAIVAFGLLLAAGGLAWAQATQRDADGWFTASERLTTPTYALMHESVDVHETPDWLLDRLGTVRIRVTGSRGSELFVGIGERAAVERYLRGIAHEEVVGVEPGSRSDLETRLRDGGAPPVPPGAAGVWSASSLGPGVRTVTWEVADGEWSAVVMNADGSRAVEAEVEIGARVDWVPALAAGLAVGGLLFAIAAASLVVVGLRRSPRDAAVVAGGAAAAHAHASTYPVDVDARLDEPLSRWLWLVKWLLAIPHFLVLAVLWCAFAVLTVVAWFAIVLTGRYPRAVFDFNVGVLRWTWRVGYYATSGIGTDRYPPFSLAREPGYPATLEVPYPERLSRRLVLVKSWLLALPHLLVVAVLAGSLVWGWSGRFVEFPGLIGILTLVAGVVLLFRGRYPADVHELVVGCNRWVYRVAAYVALMRDEYPPFRLGR